MSEETQTQIIVANAETALAWQNAIGSELHSLFTSAEQRQDQHAMQLVNAAWEKTQALTQFAQGSIAARDQALEELQGLITAIDELNEEHPKLLEFAEYLRDGAYEIAYDEAHDDVWGTAYDQGYESAVEQIKDEAEEAVYDAAYESACQTLRDNLAQLLAAISTDDPLRVYPISDLANTLFETIFESKTLEGKPAEYLKNLARSLVDEERQ